MVNAGSSSLKLRLLGPGDILLAAVDLRAREGRPDPVEVTAAITDLARLGELGAVGHRIVRGGTAFTDPVVVTDEVLKELRPLSTLAPLHQPAALAALAEVRTAAPDITQVACFDTAFHARMPPAAATYAVPTDWRDRLGVRRYGFHGLSHAYASRRAAALTGGIRVVTCHLGSGASLAAVRDGVGVGVGVDTTMGFTPLEGLVMSTRSGTVDPGLLLWLQTSVGLSVDELTDALFHRSGLAALAGTPDMRAVVDRAATGEAASSLALAVYLHRLRAQIAAMVAALGGLDTLVFTGGVGERSAVCGPAPWTVWDFSAWASIRTAIPPMPVATATSPLPARRPGRSLSRPARTWRSFGASAHVLSPAAEVRSTEGMVLGNGVFVLVRSVPVLSLAVVASPPAGPGNAGRWRRWSRADTGQAATFLDLTDIDEITATLLAPPEQYEGLRRRVVDQFTLLSANRCLLQRSVNWGPLDPLLTAVARPRHLLVNTGGRLPDEVSLLLPISTMPKRALVAFNLLGPGGSDAHLMPYTASIATQGNLVARLAADIGHPPSAASRFVVDAVSRFRPGRLSGNHPGLLPRRGDPLGAPAIREYLDREAELALSEATLRSWTRIIAEAQIVLRRALAEPFDPLSSSDNLLLAVGELRRDPAVPDDLDEAGIEAFLCDFVAWIEALDAAGDVAVPVLSTVAEYGRRWEALAAVTLDPYRPALIKMQEERRTVVARRSPLRGGARMRWRHLVSPTALVDLDPGGPGTYHVSVGTDDTSIEIRDPVVIDLFNRPVDRTFVEDVQRNREVYAYYTTDARRPARARLLVGLSVSRDVSRVSVAILLLMIVTVGLSALPFDLDTNAVAVVAVPSSFAATLLLTRERSSLAAWVLGPLKLLLLALLMALAVTAGVRAVFGWHTSL
ncbi:hypothetical protein FDG2_5340 [Candidatus Protofrankia californiensis]|uniref:Acetate kinase n=2 Tax=Protofrankia TaxID=2994361 RepID=A0A1C3PCH3_9ACTN|nr:hypothetical protein FDG2_5340 [Candidatus Protofrankia californiensis]